MICDNCKKRESVISYTMIHDNKIEEIHLCQACAEQKMKLDLTNSQNFLPQIEDFLKNIFAFTSDDNKSEEASLICPQCGTSLSDFKNTGKVGCSNCYSIFKNELKNYLHTVNPKPVHVGKIPKNADTNIVMARDLRELQDKLQSAVSLEEYEEAAHIRDEIKALKEKLWQFY